MANGATSTLSAALDRMAAQDPELATRLVVTGLPTAGAKLGERLAYRLSVDGVGTWDVTLGEGGGDARFTSSEGASENGDRDFELHTDAPTLVGLAAGRSPIGAVLSGKLRVTGNRLKALSLRRLAPPGGMREIARAGVSVDPDLVFRAMPYVIEPAWTKGHRFAVAYELLPDEHGEGGRWVVHVADGNVRVTAGRDEEEGQPTGRIDATLRLTHGTWLALLRGDITPTRAMSSQLVTIPPVTRLGRWLDRADGRDDAELEREKRQREIQQRRATWGSKGTQRVPGELLDEADLYALWERQNWRAHEIDFSVDREQWLATTTAGQQDTMWSLASFYLAEERVAADLSPYVLAAPTGEVEIFLTTQQVDEARHTVLFDRFFAEVMAIEGEDLRARLDEVYRQMGPAWTDVFDGALRGVSRRLLENPYDRALFVEAITVYHLILEGVLAMTGQHIIIDYLERHALYPGLVSGFRLIERDEHRHVAFGVRLLRDACAENPAYRERVEQTVADLVPRAALAFQPPYADDPADFNSYSAHSSEIYGYAYRALKRRMDIIGATLPPASRLMPGPIDSETDPVGAPATNRPAG
jgi:ribonucleoside-diphosphate reductase beta chain